MSILHSCIKCGNQYSDEEIDDYYCPSCEEQKKIIAKQVDAQIASRPKKESRSDFQSYEEIRRAKGVQFVNIKDLGIQL